eukprot:jgi/Psemu1/259375/estExt_Genewise1Plus.C_3510024
MNNTNKITTIDEDHIPLAQASLLNVSNAHVVTEIWTEYHQTTDDNFDSSSYYYSESEDSVVNSTSTVVELAQPQDSDIPTTINVRGPTTTTTTTQQHHYSVTSSNSDPSKTCGAWAAGTILGLIVGGPTFSMAFGVGAAYYSQQQEGIAGDVARAMGEVAILSQQKFVEVNEKHNLVNTIANSVSALPQKCFASVRNPIKHLFLSVTKNMNTTTTTTKSCDTSRQQTTQRDNNNNNNAMLPT